MRFLRFLYGLFLDHGKTTSNTTRLVVSMLTGWHERESTMKRLALISALCSVLLLSCSPENNGSSTESSIEPIPLAEHVVAHNTDLAPMDGPAGISYKTPAGPTIVIHSTSDPVGK